MPYIEVSNIGPEQRVVLSGLRTSTAPAFIARASAGAIWVQDSELTDFSTLNSYHGAEAHTSQNVVLQHCVLQGGTPSIDLGGGHGMLLFGNSRVAAWQSTFSAGTGGAPGFSGDPGQGGHGLHVKPSGEFYGMGCAFFGALGGPTSPASFDGPGVVVDAAATTRLADADITPAGTASTQIGPVQFLAASARDLTGPVLAREGAPLAWTVTGAPGDLIFLARARKPGHAYIPTAFGVLALEPPFFLGAPLGVVNGSGQLDISFNAPVLPPGVEALTFFYQVYVVETGGQRVLGTPLALEVLDAAF